MDRILHSIPANYCLRCVEIPSAPHPGCNESGAETRSEAAGLACAQRAQMALPQFTQRRMSHLLVMSALLCYELGGSVLHD